MSFESSFNQTFYTPAIGTAKKISSISVNSKKYGVPKFAVIDENETYLVTAQKDQVFYYGIGEGTLSSEGSMPRSSDIETLATYQSTVYGICKQNLWALGNLGSQPTDDYNFKVSNHKLVGEIIFYKTEDNPLYVFVMDVKGNLYQTSDGATIPPKPTKLTNPASHRDYDTNFSPQMTILDGYLFFLDYNTSPDKINLRCVDPISMKEVPNSKLLLPNVSKYGYTITVIAPVGKKPYLLLSNPINMLMINPPGKTHPGGAFKYWVADEYQAYFNNYFPYQTAYKSMDMSYHRSPPVYNVDTDQLYCMAYYHLPVCVLMNSELDGNCKPTVQFGYSSNWVMNQIKSFSFGYSKHMVSLWYRSFMDNLLDYAPFPYKDAGFCELIKDMILKDQLGNWDNILKLKLNDDEFKNDLDFDVYYKKHIEPTLPLGNSPKSINPFPERMAFGFVLLYLYYLIRSNFNNTYANKPAEQMAKIEKVLTDSKYLSLIGSELTLSQILLLGQFLGPRPKGFDQWNPKSLETVNLKDTLAIQAYLGLVSGDLSKAGLSTPVPIPHFIFTANKEKIYRVSNLESNKLGIAFCQMNFENDKYEYTFKVDPAQADIATGPYSSMHLYDNRLYIVGVNSISLYTLPES